MFECECQIKKKNVVWFLFILQIERFFAIFMSQNSLIFIHLNP